MKLEYFLKSKVHFVAGKGGVGRTLICQSLARRFARDGCKTLLVSLSEEEAEQPFTSVAKIEALDRNLYTLNIRPDQALYEYLLLKVSKPVVISSMLNNTLFRRLASAMPGLSDLVRLGKIWFHADESHAPTKEMFDKIVVDMPSSGFVPRFLSVAHVVSAAVKIGPLAKEAGLIEGYFSNADHARVHLVAVPKELVVNETLELYDNVKKDTNVGLGILFINRVLDFSESELSKLAGKLSAQQPRLRELVDFYAANVHYEQDQIDDLSRRLSAMPLYKIEEFSSRESWADMVDKIVSKMQHE